MLVLVTAAEAEVLEARDIPIGTHDGREGCRPWAVMLAAAEVHDWWAKGAPRSISCWAVAWDHARADLAWQEATDAMAARLPCAELRVGFMRGWVDTWLARAVGMRCYGAADVGRQVLRRLV